jgi:hypothetical protein
MKFVLTKLAPHTAQDTLDKLGVQSLTISGDTLLETIRLLDEGQK